MARAPRKAKRAAPAAAVEAAPAPVFWFGFEVAWAKLALARVVVFGLLALDALLQIRHAPRYGAGGFNVAQLPGLGGLAPGRVGYGVGQLLDAYLLVLAACGVATRAVVPAAAAIYAWLYFGSQLDSYQHHYLVALVLAIGSFVPWQRPAGARAATRVRSWALRLILVQLAVLYLWAAISKMTPAWLDGRTLETQVGGSLRAVIDHTVGIAWASRLVLVTELGLAATVWARPAWWVAAPVGIAFHLGIVFTGLEIGLFAWLMIALYILVVPDAIWVGVWVALAERVPWPRAASDGAAAHGWGGLALGVVAGVPLALACRIEAATEVGLALMVVPIAAAVLAARGRSRAWIGAAHALALALWCVVDRGTTVTTDYARLWGGASKRLGDPESAARAYLELVKLTPGDASAHVRLGRALLDLQRVDAGLAELHAAEALAPASARAWDEEARWLQGHGRMDEAIAKAREGTYAEPSSAEARALLDGLTGKRRPGVTPTPAPGDDGEAP